MVGTNQFQDAARLSAQPRVAPSVRAELPAAEGAPLSGVFPLKSCTASWPPQAEMVLSAIEAGQFRGSNRRVAPRRRYRVKAGLRLFSDAPDATPWAVYTRDIHARGLGFITSHRLPLGHGGVVELPAGDNRTVKIPCTLLRCREAAPGWFEGSLYFNRDQPQLGG